MPARAATPFDAPRIVSLLERALRTPDAVLASALPIPLAGGAVPGLRGLALGLVGIGGGRLRVFLEEYRGQLRSAALVYDGRRAEWVVLILGAMFEPGGADSAFRLLSGISASAARAGMHRLFAAVPDETRARETFFQAGFYSYTRETWYISAARHPRALSLLSRSPIQTRQPWRARSYDLALRRQSPPLTDVRSRAPGSPPGEEAWFHRTRAPVERLPVLACPPSAFQSCQPPECLLFA